MLDNEALREIARQELQRRQKANFYLQHPFLFHKEVLCKPAWKNNLAEIHERGLEWINQGKRKKLILWPRKHLKAQSLSSKILTRVGWKTFAEIQVGDEVVTENGYTKVSHVHPAEKMSLYRVTTDDGRSIVCNEEHLFKVQIPSNSCQFRVVPLKFLFDKWKAERFNKERGKTYIEYRTRIKPIRFEGTDCDLPIDPYTLGVWLGDGTSVDGSFTTADPEILQYLPYSSHKNHAKYRYRIDGLQKDLRKVGLLNNKHIPEEYFWSSYAQRLELLRGLMDTDGTCHCQGGIGYFVNTNFQLVEGVVRLVRSLGGIATTHKVDQKVNGEPYDSWQVSVKIEDNPFGLSRKALQYGGLNGPLLLKITNIEKIEDDFARCISIEDESGMYVSDDYFPTHNSTIFTVGESIRRALLDPDIRILISSVKHDNAKRFLGAIKGHLQSPKFIELYGNLLPDKMDKRRPDNGSELTLRTRMNLGLKEPTFSTTGLDAAQTSQHYDLIIHDDLVERRNIGTVEQIEKVITYYKDSLDLLDPGKELWVLGTRWHPLDLYGWIMESFCDPRCVENDFEHVKGCRCDFDVTLKELEEDGKYVFPSLFNSEEAEELLRQKGSYEFAAQYRNNPTDPSICWFKQAEVEAALVPVEEIQSRRSKLIWYIAVDPAESTEKDPASLLQLQWGLTRNRNLVCR